MAYSRPGEDITAGIENYLTEKEKQYSQELSEVRSHLEERVKEVKTDLREVRIDLKGDIQRVEDNFRNDLKDRISDLRWFIGIFVTSGIAVASIITALLVKFLK